MTTTTRKEDFLGRNLTNATPGTSDATDHLGRSVIASHKDYIGRSLTSAPHAISTAYTKGTVVYLAGGQELTAEVAGTSSGTPPTAPAVGATVVDGTVTWRRTE
jgi:hypothetical protein